MKIGVVGNRTGWEYSDVKTVLLRYLDKITILVSGGADGIDTYAEDFAKEYGLPILICYPNPVVKSPERYFKRNKIIAEECDILIAFNKKARSGTNNTIKYAKQFGKKVVLIAKNLVEKEVNKQDKDIYDYAKMKPEVKNK